MGMRRERRLGIQMHLGFEKVRLKVRLMLMGFEMERLKERLKDLR